MEEELNRRITEEERDQLIRQIGNLYNEGVLRIRDWVAMYDLMLEACERDRVETYEEIVVNRIKMEGGIQ